MTKKNGKALSAAAATAVLVVIILGAMFYFDPSLFTSLSRNQLSVLAVSSINIAPQGGDGQGAYWTILATTDVNEQYGLLKFNNNNLTASNNQLNGQTLQITKEIDVKIIPGRPYYVRTLAATASNVYPATKVMTENRVTAVCTWSSGVPKMDVQYDLWGEQYWELHTPFEIQVIKSGTVIIDKQIDTVGAPQTIFLQNPADTSEWLSIKDLGKLSSGYGQPTLQDIVMFSPDVIFPKTNQLMAEINYASGSDYTYSNYWFGGGNVFKSDGYVVGKDPDGAPGGFTRQYAGVTGNENFPLNDGDFPGNFRNDYDMWHWQVGVLAADEWSDQSGGHFHPAGLSLINYLKSSQGGKAADTPYSSYQMDVYHQGWTVTSDNKIKENLPYAAANSLITIQISANLCDAVVYQPPTSNIKIDALTWNGGGQIGDSDMLRVNLSQQGTVTSTATVTASYTNQGSLPVELTPTTQAYTLDPGATGTVWFNMLNTGAQVATSGTLTVTVTDNVFGKVTDTKSIDFTLLPRGIGDTQVTVFTIDKKTNELISGLTVALAWGENSDTKITSHGACTFDLTGYTGPVSATSVMTTKYKESTGDQAVGLGMNTLTLYVEPQDYTPPPPGLSWTMILLIAGIIVAVCLIGGLAYYISKHPAHKVRRHR